MALPPMGIAELNPDPIRPASAAAIRLRLYIARSTPNSVRAEQNLSAVLGGLKAVLAAPELEIIDVFLQPKRALIDGVVVTPTLLGFAGEQRIVLIGDLADQIQVQHASRNLLGSAV
jgi:circadian clock protein KaiB